MNKEKKLKLILSSFKEKELIKFFETFLDTIKCKFYKSIKQISFSCYQSTCQVDNYLVNGYGKTSSQALVSGINNIIDCLIEEEQYCEVMRQCLKKFNVSPYGLTNNGTTSKKQLLSTEKAVKTLGPESSMSLEKKVLTMSANLSSNSKNSSSKPKSIKQEIFQYFNLENLKVKNPNQSFSTITPLAANNKIHKHFGNIEISNLCKSKEKYPQKQHESISGPSRDQKQLQEIYRRIKQVNQQIQNAQKENVKLKQDIQLKKKTFNKTGQDCSNQYFTRPSLDSKQQKINPSLNTQSNKKITYLEMSLNDKLLTKDQKENPKLVKYEINNENHFEKVEIPKHFKPNKVTNGQNQSSQISGTNYQNTLKKASQQRKCLLDISNIKTETYEQQAGTKTTQYATFNGHTSKASESKNISGAFQTASNYQNQERLSTNPILYSKASQQESLSIIESSKKLRSFSVQNSLNEKIASFGTCTKNPYSILSSANMNASFDNDSVGGATLNIPQKKIKIPKLNLQILPNYHGRSNKSLNQSLMEHYEKKSQGINQIIQ